MHSEYSDPRVQPLLDEINALRSKINRVDTRKLDEILAQCLTAISTLAPRSQGEDAVKHRFQVVIIGEVYDEHDSRVDARARDAIRALDIKNGGTYIVRRLADTLPRRIIDEKAERLLRNAVEQEYGGNSDHGDVIANYITCTTALDRIAGKGLLT